MMDDFGNQYRHRGYWASVAEEEFCDDFGWRLMLPVWDMGAA